jgi:hypothetical protein
LLLQLLKRRLQELNLLLQLPQAFRQARPLEGFLDFCQLAFWL